MLTFCLVGLCAQKAITIEDIYSKGTFKTKSVPGFNFMKDGKHYSSLKDGTIKKYDLTTGSLIDNLFEGAKFIDQSKFSGEIDSYTFSEDESKIMLKSDGEALYRWSSKVNAHVYDIKTGTIKEVYPFGKILNPELSPDGEKVGFVYNNNLYYKNLKNDQITQITTDGAKNKIINGMSDWVYEEEFGFTKAFYWSPDSKKIAFIRFDETLVPQFTMQLYKDEIYPINETFKYPKVGEKNAEVSTLIYEISQGRSSKVEIGDLKGMYIPRVKWTEDPNKLCVFKLNRHQNELQLHIIDTKRSTSTVLFQEKNKYFIDITDNLTFLKDGKYFVWTSEKEGFNQVYLYDMEGKQRAKLTGNYDVTDFYGVDEKNKKVFFQAAEKSPMEKHVFSVDFDGKNLTNITPYPGINNAQFSSTFDYFSNNNSTANLAPTYIVYDRFGKKVRTIEDNVNYDKVQKEYGVSTIEFFTFTTTENVKLNGWMLKPLNFDPTRKYPVFMTQYSGPGSQSVTDGWKGSGYWWNQMIAQSGYIIVCVDGRGTGGRGEEFEKMYGEMTHEIEFDHKAFE